MYSRARVTFYGRVQGVFFRANTERKAIEIGINGWIRNVDDGTVEAVFEGAKDKIKEIISWCKKHQPHARVVNVNITWEEYLNEYDRFEIVYW